MPSIKGHSKSPVAEQLLEPNPSYGVLPKSSSKSAADETDEVVYDNDQIPDSDTPEDYVNDQPVGAGDELYDNDQPDVFEEYEYINVQSSPRSTPEISESNEYY